MNESHPLGVNYHTKSDPKINPYHLFYPPKERLLSDDQIRSEMSVIKNRLHCNAVRVVGHVSSELIKVGKISRESGLTPWYSPRFIGATFDNTLTNLKKFCTDAVAAKIQDSPLIVANELPYDCADDLGKCIKDYRDRVKYYVDNYLKKGEHIYNTDKVITLIQTARKAGWTGEITYASTLSENIDWSKINDDKLVVSCNLYWGRNYEENRPWTDAEYEEAILKLKKSAGQHRVNITEFGTVPQNGAFEKGGSAYTLDGPINYGSQRKAYKRYLSILQKCGVGYFAYAFSEPKPDKPHKNYGIALPDESGVAQRLTPAADILSFYNQQAKNTHGVLIDG